MGTPYERPDIEARTTGLLPQLLNDLTGPEQLEACLADPAWWVQEKHDGHRRMVRKRGAQVTGINRNGLAVALPKPIADLIAALPGDFDVDGELVGDQLHVFDLIEAGPYAQRLARLEALWANAPNLVHTAKTEAAKRQLLGDVEARGGEGIVLKRHDAHYEEGRPNTGGSQLKHKLWQSASVVVMGAKDDKASLQIGVNDGGKLRSVGHVKVPDADRDTPAGSVLEVKYLYARAGGGLQQASFLGHRTDIAPEACTVDQLKLKAGDEEDAEPSPVVA
jgi:bifunctional non-homologous end joining protein LigD